jgi:hypothetical protein
MVLVIGLFSTVGTGRAFAEVVQPAGPIISSTATVLRMPAIGPQQLARQFNVTAVLTDVSGNPLSNSTINFLVGDSFVGQARTNSQGQATATVNTDLPAGAYDMRVLFLGSRQYDAANATTKLTIQPSELVIQTIPALENIQFRLGDQIFTSDKSGFARIAVSRSGDYNLDVVSSSSPDPNMRVEFNRWFDDTYVPTRIMHIPQQNTVQVGFQVSYKVGQTFIDLQNQAVAVDRITSITLKSNQGTSYTFTDGQPRWLPASLVTRRSLGLEIVPIQYSVIAVVVDGSNVVSSEQQRFYTHAGDVWPIQLLLFSARFTARDAFLRSQVGQGIILEYPDGTRNHFLFGKDHTVTIRSLARGIYHVEVMGVSGYAPSTPVALSQNQDMSLSILSRLDIFMAVFLGMVFALGLVVVGRTQVLNWVRFGRRRQPALVENQPQPGLRRLRINKE